MIDPDVRQVLDTIADRLAMIQSDIRLINAQMTHQAEAGEARNQKIVELDEAIRGNGKIGLSARIELVEDWMEGQKWFQRTIISILAGEAIALIIHLFK